MNVSVDVQAIGIQLEVPLDNFLGFERAPRTDSERKRVADMVARLQAADSLFLVDQRAECTVSKVALDSKVLGLVPGGPTDEASMAKARADHKKTSDGHAEIEVSITFNCAKATQARHIDVKLFDAFKGTRRIDAQVASAQGQFKSRLTPTAARLAWGQ